MNTKWNDDWRDELRLTNENCYIRLCECRNTKNDIVIIAELMYKYNKHKGQKEALDRTLAWLTDWNDQFELDLTDSEYNDILLIM